MLNKLETFVFQKAAPRAIRRIAPPDLKPGDKVAKAVFAQAEREFQLAPPVTIHAACPTLLAGYWHLVREGYVANAAGRADREAVAHTVSGLNTCPYCVTVHDSMGAAVQARVPTDPRLLDWAAHSMDPHGQGGDLGFLSPKDQARVAATAFVFHYTNRMVSLFLNDSPVALPLSDTRVGRFLVSKSMALLSRRLVSVSVTPGEAAVQADADLPPCHGWAAGDPVIARAAAHFATAATETGRRFVPEPVRDVLTRHLGDWRGQDAPLSTAWTHDLVSGLAPTDQAVGRFVLLAARAPWQVDDALAAQVRDRLGSDAALIGAAGWAAFTATARIGNWWRVAS